MRLEARPRRPGEPPLGALFGAVLLVGGGLAAMWVRLGLPTPACQLRAWTGVPCPTCGSTRLVESLLRGDLLAAFAWNPLTFTGLAAVGAWAVASVAWRVAGRSPYRLILGRAERNLVRVLAVAAVAAGWVYVLQSGA